MIELTDEQKAAADSRGKVIVSASAGSGKTFVMIEKLTRAILGGADLDKVLAVTFTKKAAGQIKDKLRTALVSRLEGASGEQKARLKAQLSKIPSADISTIHSFCAKLLRTYFYALGIDGGFDIISDDDALSKELKERALDSLFERCYETDDEDFIHLLKRFFKKRNDVALKNLLLESYSSVRTVAHYRDLLSDCKKLYTVEGFETVCNELNDICSARYEELYNAVERFSSSFPKTESAEIYERIFGEMKEAVNLARTGGLFGGKVPVCTTKKPRDGENDKQAGELFKKFRGEFAAAFSAVRDGIEDREIELDAFLQSGRTACAFCNLLLQFDGEYTAVKRDENKLDYNDLEHLVLELLQNEDVRREIDSTYDYVYVDEYQDVNPVQEEIISSLGGDTFLVGDIKQAIYGFRGSKSLFFAEKFDRYEGGGGTALRLTDNFRSCNKVIDFVNRLFSQAMTEETCGFAYKGRSEMSAGAGYPPESGFAGIHIFGKEESVPQKLPVYSVISDSRPAPHTAEGLAVLSIVEKELESVRYDLGTGGYTAVQPGDICILTRKNKGESVEGIVRALTAAGYPVSGAQDVNICNLPEVKQMLDILSLIDNAAQDVPLVSAMLSPFGGFTEDELARIRIAFKAKQRTAFRICVKNYGAEMKDGLAIKIQKFTQKLNTFRDLSEILTAGEIIDKLSEELGLEISVAGGGEKYSNVLRLAAEGADLSLTAFLHKIKAGGYNISAPSAAPSDSIKIMTMHAAKGLEFPVVILADICRTFKGRESSELPFDDKYGFAAKCYDEAELTVRGTLLRRLVKLRADADELKNELNLFYVACTRAMCSLHIMAEECKPYEFSLKQPASYAEFFDMSAFEPQDAEMGKITESGGDIAAASAPDPRMTADIARCFMQKYAHADSVDLPVKSSASAIMRTMKEDEPYFAENALFGGEGETGTERGTAYHRFLELCDFSVNTADGIRGEIADMLLSGSVTAVQADELDAEELEKILSMPVFSSAVGAEIFREREFLCRMKACEVMDSAAEDYVLIQGAIDLLIKRGDDYLIVDYKYSKKDDGALLESYKKQLDIYKKAVARICRPAPRSVKAMIVNIHRRRQIPEED